MFRFRLLSIAAALPAALACLIPCNETRAQDGNGQKYAVLVGVNKYEHDKLRAMSYAEADVTALADLLKPAGYQVTLLTGAAREDGLWPTKKNIEGRLKAVLAGCKKGDTVLLAFAGHGLQFEGQPDCYFCPQDARPFKDAADSLLSLGGVYKELERSFAGMKVLLVDACRDDPEATRGVNADTAPRPPLGVAALFSCRAGERAYEHDKLKHGVFFYHVLEGLKSEAHDKQNRVTFAGLAAYVSQEVADGELGVAKLVGGEARQSPNLKADYSTEPVLLRAAASAGRPGLAFRFVPLARADAARWGLKAEGQPQVAVVLPGGGADLAGLRRGDVLLRINGRAVDSVAQGDAALRLKQGAGVKFEVLREGKQLALAGRYETAYPLADEVSSLLQAAANDAAAQHFVGVAYANGRGVKKDVAEAVKWYQKAADQGYGNAAFNMGLLYKNGRDVPKDEAEAVRWYRKAAEQGFADAQNNLGLAYANGQGGLAKDAAEAVRWYKMAAEQGNAWGQLNLGVSYANGRGLAKDDSEAVRCYRQAAERGNANAQNNLGWMCQNGRGGLTKDAAEAAKWYRKAADQGFAQAQQNLGMLYTDGRGVAKDAAEALRLYRKAAEQGNANAFNALGLLYEHGRGGLSKDPAEAAQWYRKAAAKGNAAAQNNFAGLYANGRGVSKDVAEAARWYRKAADQGSTNAQNSLGKMYQDGRGVSRDDAEAVRWYRKAADQGNAAGQNNLGYMYQHGRGVSKDLATAVKWFRKSADQGHSWGQNNLGLMYETGKGGLAKDQAAAARWYRKAADQGLALAQYNLGLMYEQGRGVKRSAVEARRWYRLAADQGDKEARAALKHLSNK
jgi:TPR repeat protein